MAESPNHENSQTLSNQKTETPPCPSPSPPLSPVPPPPPGFNLVECPGKVINSCLPLIKFAVTNPNKNIYFCHSLTGEMLPVTSRDLRFCSRAPLFRWSWELRGLMMETPKGKVVPGHLPSLMDLEWFPQPAMDVLMHMLDKLDEDDNSPIFPDEWVRLLDPEPVVRDYSRVFLLRNYWTINSTANNTNQLDIYRVSHFMTLIDITVLARWVDLENCGMRLMNTAKINGGVCEYSEPIPMHSYLIVWNVRGVSRLGFGKRFKQVVETHRPLLLVLMETRASRKQMGQVAKELVGDYQCESCDSGGLHGGVAVLWDANVLKMSFDKSWTSEGPRINCVMEVDQHNLAKGQSFVE